MKISLKNSRIQRLNNPSRKIRGFGNLSKSNFSFFHPSSLSKPSTHFHPWKIRSHSPPVQLFCTAKTPWNDLQLITHISKSFREGKQTIQWLTKTEREHIRHFVNQDNPLKAYGYWRQLNNHTDDIVFPIAHALCRNDHLSEALEVYEELHPILKQYKSAGSLAGMLVNQHLKQDSWPLALHVLSLAYIHQTPVDTACLNSVLNGFLTAGRVRDALSLYDRVISPSVDRKNLVKNPKFARDFNFSSFQKSFPTSLPLPPPITSPKPPVRHFDLERSRKDSEARSLQLVSFDPNAVDPLPHLTFIFKSYGLSPTPATFRTFFTALARSKLPVDHELIWELWNELIHRNLFPNEAVLPFLAHLASKFSLDSILPFVNFLIPLPFSFSDKEQLFYHELVRGLSIPESIELIDKLRQNQFSPAKMTPNTLIMLLQNQNILETDPRPVLQVIQQNRELIDARLFPNLFQFLKKKKVAPSPALLEQFHQSKHSSHVLGSFLDMYSTIYGLENTIRYMKKNQLMDEQFSGVTFNILLKSALADGNFSSAAELLRERTRLGITLTVDTYNILIDGFLQHGQLDQALEFWFELQTAGLAPTFSTLRLVKQIYIEKKNWQEISKINAMIEKSFRPLIKN